jgi:molybdopterin synthase sulfur carrier subunit
MATVTIRYWAAAREAAGVTDEAVEAVTLDDALVQVVAQRSPGPGGDRLRAVLARSSFLVNGDPAGKRAAAAVLVLPEEAVIEVLPAFAGGLTRATGTADTTGFRCGLGRPPEVAAHWRGISKSVRLFTLRSQCHE